MATVVVKAPRAAAAVAGAAALAKPQAQKALEIRQPLLRLEEMVLRRPQGKVTTAAMAVGQHYVAAAAAAGQVRSVRQAHQAVTVVRVNHQRLAA